MNILVTGGAGFIGSHTVKHLLAKGHAVVVLDSLATGKRSNVPDGVRFVQADVREFEPIEEAIRDCEVVIHLAAMVSVIETIHDPELCTGVNVLGSRNVLRAAKEAGARKVVLASSAAVYGMEPVIPTGEEAELRPASPYAKSKVEMEEHAELYAKAGLETCSLRFFNVYGPGQNPKSQYAAAIPAFIGKALSGEQILINGDGLQTRDFIYVEDVAKAVELALQSGGGAINVATGESVTINELAKTILRLTKSTAQVHHGPARAGDPRASRANVRKAEQELGFKASVSLNEGLAATITAIRR